MLSKSTGWRLRVRVTCLSIFVRSGCESKNELEWRASRYKSISEERLRGKEVDSRWSGCWTPGGTFACQLRFGMYRSLCVKLRLGL